MRTREAQTPEEQFALLLDGVLSPEEVQEDIARLANVVRPLRHTSLPTPDRRWRNEFRQRIVAEATAPNAVQRVRDAMWERTARWRHSARVATASFLAASMLGTAGVAAAAQHALPGEFLYGVKQATESLRLALAGDLLDTGSLRLSFAEERLSEVDEGALGLRSDLLIDTLETMDDQSNRGSGDLLRAFAFGSDSQILTIVDGFVERQRSGLADVTERLPVDVKPFAEQSLEVLRRIETQVEAAACGCDPDGDGPLPAPSTDGGAVNLPGDGPAAPPALPCDCQAPEPPRPPREPAPLPPEPPAPPPPNDDPPPTDPPGDDPPVDDRVIVPELPGPLDPVGDVLDDVIDDLLDDLGVTPPVDDPPVDELPPSDLPTEEILPSGNAVRPLDAVAGEALPAAPAATDADLGDVTESDVSA